MEERKWDELNRDCLVEILSKVGITSLAKYVPFVCKSWYDATLDPRCWRFLDFHCDVFLSTKYIKFVVDRSQSSATYLEYPTYCSQEGVDYISDECPALKTLNLLSGDVILSTHLFETNYLSQCIGKWKNLEILKTKGFCFRFDILIAISQHCKNFVGFDGYFLFVSHEGASTIVDFVPKIKYLTLKSSFLPRKSLLLMLKGCRELELLDVSHCTFDPDKEILGLASHIKTFNYVGSSSSVRGLQHAGL